MKKITFLVISFLLSCSREQYPCSFECRQFYSVSRPDDAQTLSKFPIEIQYQIYRRGADSMEPPRLELASPIAERGVGAIYFIKRQLESTSDGISVRDNLFILQTMQASGFYNVSEDRVLLNAARSACTRVRSSIWAGQCREFITTIETHRESSLTGAKAGGGPAPWALQDRTASA